VDRYLTHEELKRKHLKQNIISKKSKKLIPKNYDGITGKVIKLELFIENTVRFYVLQTRESMFGTVEAEWQCILSKSKYEKNKFDVGTTIKFKGCRRLLHENKMCILDFLLLPESREYILITDYKILGEKL